MATSATDGSFIPKRCIAGSITLTLLILASSSVTPARGQCSPQQFPKLLAGDVGLGGNPYRFGTSAALSGDIAVIGTPGGFFNQGAAYVFVPSANVWTQQVRLTASDAEIFDNFGFAVAVSGETAIVGASSDDHDGGIDAGSAYVFIRNGTVWTQQARLFAADAAESQYFGDSVALSGDTAVVGAVGNGEEGSLGSAYVFVRNGTTWTQQSQLAASGISVAVSGETAVVGASEAAYVYVRSGTTWSEQAILENFTGLFEFGVSVAISGETAVVGQPNSGGFGLAHVFKRVGTNWPEQAQLSASDETVQNFFGNSVAISGDTAVIGAVMGDIVSPGSDEGAAYVFTRTGTVWTERSKLVASDAMGGDAFGSSVAASGDTAVAGADLDDNTGGIDAGAAYVFDLNCGEVPACCPGDFDASNNVTTADISGFVAALLAGNPCAAPPACCTGNFNLDGTVNGADVTGFLEEIFSGGACP
ncbi:MAG TPA: hypothetical protein VNT79_16935 [Phycisphaerae bacterium]|nr:hypothetical protein [Phycisphaerae bacterium]